MECEHEGRRLGAIREGVCPRCGLPMEPHEDHGRCECCGGCWSAEGDTVTFVAHPRIPDALLRRTAG